MDKEELAKVLAAGLWTQWVEQGTAMAQEEAQRNGVRFSDDDIQMITVGMGVATKIVFDWLMEHNMLGDLEIERGTET